MDKPSSRAFAKVPEITTGFWLIKILATTLGETGGDAVTMSMNLGYLIGTCIFGGLFVLAVGAQIRMPRFHPSLYWTTIIASTTVGTTLADFVDRSLGIGYIGGTTLLMVLLLCTLYAWHRSLGSIAIGTVRNRRSELFYWATITFSQTLGTALGDWVADTAGRGYLGGAAIFGSLLVLILALQFWSNVSRTLLFWSAFILTRPFGAVVGDFLDKPIANGGLELNRYAASLVLLAAIAALLFLLPQNAARRAH